MRHTRHDNLFILMVIFDGVVLFPVLINLSFCNILPTNTVNPQYLNSLLYGPDIPWQSIPASPSRIGRLFVILVFGLTTVRARVPSLIATQL